MYLSSIKGDNDTEKTLIECARLQWKVENGGFKIKMHLYYSTHPESLHF